MSCFACALFLAIWLLCIGVPARCVVLHVRCPGPLGSCSQVCRLGVLCCMCGVLGHLAPVHRCACVVCCVASVVSWATWLLFTGVRTRCVALRVRCPGPSGPCSPLVPLGAFRCVCGVLGHLAPVHRCARSVLCFTCAVSWPAWLLFTGVPARCVVLRVRCPWPLGSCSPVCPVSVLFCVCGVLGHLTPVPRCARSVRCFVGAVSGATWLLLTGVPLSALLCVCGVLGHLTPVHWCARVVCFVACVVSWATWHLFTGVPARCVALCVRSPGPLGSCSPVCLLGALCCVCGLLGHLAPVHRCAHSVRCFACAASWATWLLFTAGPARCVVLRVRCPRPLGTCSPVCRSVLCFTCAVYWAALLLFTAGPARCVVLRVRCPGPLGSCSPVCPLGALLYLCGVLGHLVPVHRWSRWVRCVACAVSWATWLLFTGVPAWFVVSRVQCSGSLGSCSPVRLLGALFYLCGVLGHLAPVHWCARPVYCVAFAVSLATWLLFTGVPAQCVALCVRCPGPLDPCSTVRPLGALLCWCGVLGHLAPVHRCARSLRCFVCAVSWAT